MPNMIYLRVINEFYDEEAGVWRSQTDGLFQETRERSRELLAAGNVEVAIGSLIEEAGEKVEAEEEVEEKAIDPEYETTMLKGPPENRSLSGPSENKQDVVEGGKIRPPIARERLEKQNVETLRAILEEDLNIDLPSGYIKKDELINRIMEGK